MAFPYPPNLPTGVSDEVMPVLEDLRREFSTETPFLKAITDHFVEELERDVSLPESTNLTIYQPMNVTWVTGFPTGDEQGRYITLDLGGTNLRVCDVVLASEKSEFESFQQKYKLPEYLRSAPAADLWDFVADCLGSFLHEHHQGGQSSNRLPVAFCFSYPVEQESIRSGILQRWTKDFRCPGVEGEDIVAQLETALDKKKVPVQIIALANDTTGTMIASAYKDPDVKIGSIFSTGCNAAYMETCGAVPKIRAAGHPVDSLVAINTEYGGFDNSSKILHRTRFDKDIDAASARPKQQLYEKMVAGLYMGEIVRRILLELHTEHGLFAGQDVSRLHERNILDSSFLSSIDEDASDTREVIDKLMRDKLNLDTTFPERKTTRYIVEVVGTRSARLYSCGIAAICKKRGMESGKVGVDGSVFNYYTRFRLRAAQALRGILDWPENSPDPIVFQQSEDGSGIGAALVAALAMNQPSRSVDGVGVDGV